MFQPLPSRYAFLTAEPAPKVLVEMLKLHGLQEAEGDGDNPFILEMARSIRAEDYNHDKIPWCGLGMGYAAHMAGYDIPATPLWAQSWAEWGTGVREAMLGDVLVFRRVGGGHVGLYVGEDDESYHVLGCNQRDGCNITRFGRRNWTKGDSFGVVAIRRSPWKVGQPENIRKIRLGADGPIGGKVT